MTHSVTIPLTLSKSTKGTHVYANVDRGFSGIYVPKELLPKQAPATITMTLSCEGEAQASSRTAPSDEEAL